MKRIYPRGIPFTLTSFFLLLLLLPVFAMAEGAVDVDTVDPIGKTSALEGVQRDAINGVLKTNLTGEKTGAKGEEGDSEVPDMSKIDGSAYIPDTTIEDANQWVNEKGNDLIGFGGNVAEKIAILGFMVGLLVTLVGAVSRSHHITKGFIIMAISICVYVGAVFAPEIVHYFSRWLTS